MRRLFIALGTMGSALVLSAAVPIRQPVDLLIRGGTVVDGTGAPRRRADVAISNGQIVAIGRQLSVTPRAQIDAAGLVVAPGFIDSHNHSAITLTTEEGSLNKAFVQQGVTTVVVGADGEQSPDRMETLVASYSKRGIATNIAFYVGHNGVRQAVLGDDQDRAPTPEELARMQALVRKGMEMGAVGFASGLMYTPGLFAETDEVVALAKAAAPYGAVYETHVRDPHRALLQSNWEAINIGRQAGIPVQLTHLTTPGKQHRGLMRNVIEQIEDARRDGITVVADQYPYNAVATTTAWALLGLPEELKLKTREDIRAALRDADKRALIRRETLTGGKSGFSQFKASGPSSILILSCPGCADQEDRFLVEAAAARRLDGFDALVALLLEASDDIVVSLGGFYEEDVQRLMVQPWTMIASDGYIPDIVFGAGFGTAHPRSTGTFPRVLGRYVRELRLLTLEDAVRKMTSAPADFLGLEGRGRVRVGAVADLTIFDPKTVADASTWKQPLTPPRGIMHVLVAGKPVLRDGASTGERPGTFVRKSPASKRSRQAAAPIRR